MQHRMLIECDPFETRVAVLEDERPVEVFVERHRSRGLVGNIYRGRVTRVLAGMQAAFLDIGLERDAFLYVADAQPPVARVEEEGDRARRLIRGDEIEGSVSIEIGNRDVERVSSNSKVSGYPVDAITRVLENLDPV